jgi:integrase
VASAFWGTQKGKRVLLVKWRDAGGAWVGPRRAKGCRTLDQARRFADDKERQAERQRHGLDPIAGDQRVTFGDLSDSWWKHDGRHRRSDSKHAFRASLEKHLGELRPLVLNAATVGAFADRLQELLRQKLERNEIASETHNHLRAGVHRMFECARDPKRRLWNGENPIRWVKRATVVKARREVLTRDQVLPVLAAFPEPTLGAPWRWAAAICTYAGTRPGEAFGLRKDDVDLATRRMRIERSWSAPFPKNQRAREILIVPELVLHLEAAMRASPNHLVLPRADGELFAPTIRWNLVDHLRRAMVAAGFVAHYEHTCRRCKSLVRHGVEGAPAVWTWTHADAEQRACPACGMKLWITPVPRPMVFKNLRTTHATILRKAHVDLGATQRQLGHSDPKITAAVYDQSELEDERAAIERALTFAPPAPPPPPRDPVRHGEPVVRLVVVGKSEGPAASEFPREDGAFRWSGRLDLNQRPLAPQGRPLDAQAPAPGAQRSQPVELTTTHRATSGASEAPGAPNITGCGEPLVSHFDKLELDEPAWLFLPPDDPPDWFLPPTPYRARAELG